MRPHPLYASALAALAGAVLFCSPALAGPPGPTLNAQQRSEVLQTLSTKLSANYVFPDVASRLVAALPARLQAYPAEMSAQDYAERLSKDLRTIGQDRHFRVFHDPRFVEPAGPEAVPSAEDMARQRTEVAEMG